MKLPWSGMVVALRGVELGMVVGNSKNPLDNLKGIPQMPYGMKRSDYEAAVDMFKRMPDNYLPLVVNDLRKKGEHQYADIGEALAACREIGVI